MSGSKRIIILCDSIFTAVPGTELIRGWIALERNIIAAVGEGDVPMAEMKVADTVWDYRGKLLTPGLVDAHTHLVFGGSRERELGMKLRGASYMEIHREGGIKSTVQATRASDAGTLAKKALATLRSMLLHGTTTAEAKSGYGLDLETELRVLRVMRDLNEAQAVSLVPTYMGAHDVPPEFQDANQYIDFMIEKVLPLVREEKLAEFCDIFCEKNIFELAETKRFGEAVKDMGFALKVHADEIEPMGGAGLAASLGAVSAEHLMAISDEDIKKMAQSGTVAVLLPATTFFLMAKSFAPARKMLEAGVHVAIASDYNPGSSPCENLQMAMSMACFQMKLTPLEILRAVTIEGARAIGKEEKIGSIEVGKTADLVVFDAADPDYLLYHFGINTVQDVIKEGVRVVCGGAIVPAALSELQCERRYQANQA